MIRRIRRAHAIAVLFRQDGLRLRTGNHPCMHALQVQPQHIQHRRRLIAGRIHPAAGVRARGQAQGIKKAQHIGHGHALQHPAGKIRIAKIARLTHVSQVAASVAGSQQLFTHAVAALQNRHARAHLPCLHSGGEARRPAAENENRFVFHQFLMFSFLAAFLYASMIAS